MTDSQSIWTDRTRWADGWTTEKTLEGGAQGRAWRARRNCDGRVAFLKEIKQTRDSERRARFFREATAYDTIKAPGIPRLIESNAHRWETPEVTPYIATEFIEGPTLRRWREAEPHVELDAAVETTRALLIVLRACHADRVVHRDIKPDNIILANGDTRHPMLLDFGLSYQEIDGIDFATERWQEMGNRFLRLPELSAGSLLKQDPRSDISFAAGILFYILTGKHPDVLQDSEGRLPHQRPETMPLLEQVAGSRVSRLLALFDSTFDPLIAARVTTADAMLERLGVVMSPRPAARSDEDLLQEIHEVTGAQAVQRLAETQARLEEGLQQVQRVQEDVRNSLRVPVDWRQIEWSVSGGRGTHYFVWIRRGSDEDILSVKCEVQEAGDEIVVSLSGEQMFRTSIDGPTYGEKFDAKVRSWLIARLHDALTNPNAPPPEVDLFGERRPYGSLKQAREEADASRRKMLAFVFDPAQKCRSNLRHCLRYFLQNAKTRDAMYAAFIVALVPLSQVTAVTDILNGESMENARWILFNDNLEPQQQEVIYANAQEAEKIMLCLAKRYGP